MLAPPGCLRRPPPVREEPSEILYSGHHVAEKGCDGIDKYRRREEDCDPCQWHEAARSEPDPGDLKYHSVADRFEGLHADLTEEEDVHEHAEHHDHPEQNSQNHFLTSVR